MLKGWRESKEAKAEGGSKRARERGQGRQSAVSKETREKEVKSKWRRVDLGQNEDNRSSNTDKGSEEKKETDKISKRAEWKRRFTK